jgi:xanthine dehydrogenase accessory factor
MIGVNMDSVNLEVLKTALKWSESGAYTLLVTVVRTWGSAPRPVGSVMTIRDDGRVHGSISGGCIEDDLIEKIQRGAYRETRPSKLIYGLSAEEAHRFGLPCGGTMEIVLECVTVDAKLQPLLDAVASHTVVTRTLDLESGQVTLLPGAHAAAVELTGNQLVTVHGPRFRLVIVGAAHASRYLADMANSLDYEVIVCDPRQEYLDEWDIAGVQLSREMPDDLLLRLQLDRHSAVVTLTHDPKLDDMALLEALKSPAFYVGSIGSRANNEKRRERLALFDLTPEEIGRLHGPIGMHIGARTPPEIAIAILAEMTAIRNGIPVLQSQGMRETERNGGAATVGCAL